MTSETVGADLRAQDARDVQPPDPDSYAGLRAQLAACESARIALLSKHRQVRAERDRLAAEVEHLTALIHGSVS